MKKRMKLIVMAVLVVATLCTVVHPVSSSVGAKIIEPEKNLTGKKLTYYTSGSFLYSLEDGEATIWGYLGDGTTKIEMDTLVIPSEVDGYPVTKIGKGSFLYNQTVLTDGTEIRNTLFFDKLVIEKGIKRIEYMAFDSTTVKEVILPNGLKKLGDFCFDDCSKLKKIKLPSTLDEIGCGAFTRCISLKSITIPSNCTEIHASAFSNCTNLKKVKLHENLAYISDGAFAGCESLKELEIPDNVSELGENIIGTDEYSEYLKKKLTKIIMRPMDIDMDWITFSGIWMEIWIYRGSDAEKYVKGAAKIHYMKPDISTKKLKVKKGEATPLVMYGARKKVKWHIEDKSVVKLVHYGGKDRNVTVKGKKKGSTTVTATYKGKTYSCKVVVK